jgi:Ca2+-binding EF-hand superfamily protein
MALTAMVLLDGPVFAQDTPQSIFVFPQDYFSVSDSNGDGAVDYYEHSAYLKGKKGEGSGDSEAEYFTAGMSALRLADADGNGTLSADEVAAAGQRAQAAGALDWAGFLAEADTDKDGAVSVREYDALLRKALADADKDGDGHIDQAELDSANWAMALQRQAGAVPGHYNAGMSSFRGADSDGNGKLSGVEVKLWQANW